MQAYEYQVIPAPRRGEKAKGARTTEERFALALTTLMNRLGAEGWEYVRADVLPCDERVGLTGSKTTFQNMLVFRRALTRPEEAVPAPAAPLILSGPRLGLPEAPEGAAPPLGPAKSAAPGLAAE
jgi:hypothetical protein